MLVEFWTNDDNACGEETSGNKSSSNVSILVVSFSGAFRLFYIVLVVP